MRCRAFDHINCLIKKLRYEHDCQEYINVKALDKMSEEIKTILKDQKCKKNT